jgi:SAM-dependent methyltransferase
MHQEYEEYRKTSYSHHDRLERDQWATEIVDHLKLTKPTHILNIGCGCGELSRKLINNGHTVTSTNKPGWAEWYQGAIKEQEYNEVEIIDYTFIPNNFSENLKNIESLRRNTSQKYDLVLAQRFSMHIEYLAKKGYREIVDQSVEPIDESVVYKAHMDLVKQLSNVCKDNAVMYIGFSPRFSTHKGCGSQKLLRYLYSMPRMGGTVLKFNVKDI